MSDNATNAQVYNSTYRLRLDDKRRVQVPSMWRPTEETFQFTLIVWPGHQEGTCLRVLPPKEMAEVLTQLDSMPNENRNKTVLKRIIGSASCQVQPDKAGRLCVPEEMASAAGIKGDVVLVGMLDRFEIWDAARYEKVKVADDVMSPDAFKLME
jgi:MraZ protein